MEEPTIRPVQDLVTEEQSDSLMSQLAAKRKEIAESKETYIPVPGYDRSPPLLLIKYRLLEGPELEIIGNNIRREFKKRWDRQMYAAVDTMIMACVGLFLEDADGNKSPLTMNGVPITSFTRELAEGMQFTGEIQNADRHRDVVFGLFANNDIAIAQHNFLLSRWMSDTSIDVSAEFYDQGNL
jgi:hypothetical protein